MPAYALLCSQAEKSTEEKPDVLLNIERFPKYSEKWRQCWAGKFKTDKMAKLDKTCYIWEMKDCGLACRRPEEKGTTAVHGPLSAFFLFCSEF